MRMKSLLSNRNKNIKMSIKRKEKIFNYFINLGCTYAFRFENESNKLRCAYKSLNTYRIKII